LVIITKIAIMKYLSVVSTHLFFINNTNCRLFKKNMLKDIKQSRSPP